MKCLLLTIHHFDRRLNCLTEKLEKVYIFNEEDINLRMDDGNESNVNSWYFGSHSGVINVPSIVIFFKLL